jgi:hypothetical protein
MIRADSAGGCINNGGTQQNVNCSNNVNNAPGNSNPNNAGNINIDLRWIVILYILFSIGFVLADDSTGGCINNGGNQSNVNCSNNTNNPDAISGTSNILSLG